jgi:hypothetical protein
MPPPKKTLPLVPRLRVTKPSPVKKAEPHLVEELDESLNSIQVDFTPENLPGITKDMHRVLHNAAIEAAEVAERAADGGGVDRSRRIHIEEELNHLSTVLTLPDWNRIKQQIEENEAFREVAMRFDREAAAYEHEMAALKLEMARVVKAHIGKYLFHALGETTPGVADDRTVEIEPFVGAGRNFVWVRVFFRGCKVAEAEFMHTTPLVEVVRRLQRALFRFQVDIRNAFILEGE